MGKLEDFFGGWMKGGIPGGIAGIYQGKANGIRSQGLAEAQAQMSDLQRSQYAQRMADLQKAQQYFQPAAGALKHLYGIDMPMPDFSPQQQPAAPVAPSPVMSGPQDPHYEKLQAAKDRYDTASKSNIKMGLIKKGNRPRGGGTY